MKTKTCTLIAILALASTPALAREDHIKVSIQQALAKGQSYKTTVDPDIKLYFGSQKTPAVAKRIGEWTSNKKTSHMKKSDQEACDIAFISAVASLQERARKEGGNAVINIKSFYQSERSESSTEYVCGAGSIMVGVSLTGTVVTIKK
jgi:uncharacterized protein YbjQ (UPF0145 family)